MSKKISQFTQITTRNNDDWLLIEEAATGAYRRIKVSDFIANLGSSTGGSGSSESPSEKTLNYVSDGDTNGVFYWIGTNGLKNNYQNPATNGSISVTANSVHENHVPANLFDRGDKLFHSGGGDNNYFQIDLINYSLLITHYTLKGRSDFDGHHLRSWKLQGSNDASTWIDIDSIVNSDLPRFNTWFNKSIANQTTYYRYIKFPNTGFNTSGQSFLTCGEFEVYGILKKS